MSLCPLDSDGDPKAYKQMNQSAQRVMKRRGSILAKEQQLIR